MKNISKEDYLSVIYKSADSNGEIKANQIAEQLNISAAAVTDMLRKLSKEGYVDYKRYKGRKLTRSGEEYARSMDEAAQDLGIVLASDSWFALGSGVAHDAR